MNQNFKNGNQETIEAYNFSWSQYQRNRDQDIPQDVLQEHYNRLDWLVNNIDKSASILEIGSGAGDDALYLQSLGYRINCSEASLSAINLLNNKGLSVQKLNILTDEIPDNYQLILALSVVAHFNPEELQLACNKIFEALNSSGRFSFTTVEGRIEGSYSDALGKIRYISHLPESDIEIILRQSGFNQIEIKKNSINDVTNGLSVIAIK